MGAFAVSGAAAEVPSDAGVEAGAGAGASSAGGIGAVMVGGVSVATSSGGTGAICGEGAAALPAVDVDGGRLLIDWDEATDHVLMTGPVEVERTGLLSV